MNSIAQLIGIFIVLAAVLWGGIIVSVIISEVRETRRMRRLTEMWNQYEKRDNETRQKLSTVIPGLKWDDTL